MTSRFCTSHSQKRFDNYCTNDASIDLLACGRIKGLAKLLSDEAPDVSRLCDSIL